MSVQLLLDCTLSVRIPTPYVVMCSVEDPCRSTEQRCTTLLEDLQKSD